ncbi:MAG: hypothetical protein R3F49_13005 [Planctomycetota bacterium]
MERVILKSHNVTERRASISDAQRVLEAASAVRIVREGDRVRALEVTCLCGERVTIELSYDGEAAQPVRSRAA